MSEDPRAAIERRTDEAFARSPWADPRALYRSLLRQLKQSDAAAYESAVQVYRAGVEAPLASGSVDPVDAWLAYGRRLVELAAGGRTVSVDADGRMQAEASSATPALWLHLPADESAAAIVVAQPREPSPAQRATVALLADRLQALPG